MPVIVEQRRETRPWALKMLPPFPQVAMRLLDILSKDDAVMKQIVDLVRMDPAFGAEILRLANSAAYGFRAQIDSLRHAIVLLGTDRVKALTMTVAVGTYARKALKIDVLKKCWQHSLATAFLTEELAAACSVNRDRAYTAGLLHDIGRLALLVGYPVEYSNLIAVANENAMDICDVERAMFDVDHHEAGRWLAVDWKFPPELLGIISQLHTGPTPQPLGLPALVHLACNLSDTLGFQAIAPLQPWTFDQVIGELPATARSCFPEPANLAETIQKRVSTVGG